MIQPITRYLAILLLLSLTGMRALASHIAGAELTYRCTGVSGGLNQYQVTLKLYRDCEHGNPGATYPNPVYLYIFRSATQANEVVLDVPMPASTPNLQPENWGACTGSPNTLCIQEGIYEYNFSLAPIPGGYDLAYALCCRNSVISNLANPTCEGVTFLAHIPGSDVITGCNSMPEFKNRPSLFLCAGMMYNFDHSALDPDGDSLVYSISNPFTGLNTQSMGAGAQGSSCPGTQPPPVVDLTNPMGNPPYQNVVFGGGYSFNNPFGPGGYISIDPATGYLSAMPMNLGVYVVAISVKEYRNGQFLSENKRDFQFNVIACNPQGQAPVITPNLSGLNVTGDTVYAEASHPFCFNFSVTDSPAVLKILVNPVSVIFGGSGGISPPYATISTTGNNPVTGTLCWKPSCNEIGRIFPVILTARDSLDCPNYNIAKDTLWIRVVASPSYPPVLWHDLSGNNANGDTLLIEVQDTFCFDFYVLDTVGGGSLLQNVNIFSPDGTQLINQFMVSSVLSGDTLKGRLCWTSYCNYDTSYMFVIRGTDINQCPPNNTGWDTVWLRVLRPQTFFPDIYKDLSGNLVSNDTLFVLAHQQFCFQFGVIDTSGAAQNLLITATPEEIPSGGFTGALPSVSTQWLGDTLLGTICWTPTCSNVNKVYRIILKGEQENICQIRHDVYDTVYVKVGIEAAPPPQLSIDLSGNARSGDTLLVYDRAEFCFAFALTDTHTPTHVSLIADLYRPDGSPVSSPAYIQNFSVQSDSLIAGQFCWHMPCELSGGTFLFRLMGQDTFDCGLFNMILDSVWVRNIETLPGQPLGCTASVEPGDHSISFSWEDTPPADIAAYRIQRREQNGSLFVDAGTISASAAFNFLDVNGIDASGHAYCYRVIAIDSCGNEGPPSDELCTMLLNANANGYTSELQWSPFIGWPNGISAYEVYFAGWPDTTQYSLLFTNPESLREYFHKNVPAPVDCYYIRAIRNTPGCGGYSSSNRECLIYPPKIWFPNAFSPNDDGLNDSFLPTNKFLQVFHMRIYDRWGKLFFESYDPARGWDGQQVPEGVYLYLVDAQGFDGEQIHYTGTITLIR